MLIVAHTKSSEISLETIEMFSACINSILPKISELELQLEAEVKLRQNAEKEAADLRDMKSKLKDLLQQAHREDEATAVEGEIPEDDYVKMVKKLENALLKHTELEYEIENLRRINSQKDKLLGGIDMATLMLKMDRLVKSTSQMRQYNELFTYVPTVSKLEVKMKNQPVHEENSLHPHNLVDKINILEGQIDVLSEFVASAAFQQVLKTKRKDALPPKPNVNSEQQEELRMLAAEKTRLENYLKVYSHRINSLSTVIVFYQTQFKALMAKFRESKVGKEFNSLVRTQLGDGNKQYDDDDNESFAQYEIESVANSATPVKLVQPIEAAQSERADTEIPLKGRKQVESAHDVDTLNEIITLKNILIQTQQEELGKLISKI